MPDFLHARRDFGQLLAVAADERELELRSSRPDLRF
jgi:hypothetical protein